MEAGQMRIHHYANCWNEARILQFFFRHYEHWVKRFVIYDDGSDDGSLDILATHPRVELRRFQRRYPESHVLSNQALFNECWKESRGQADWVIVGNIDEHLHHPRLPDYLAECRRCEITAIPALGYQMLCDEFPLADARLCDACTRGAPWVQMSKLSLFNPDAMEATQFGVGRHSARPRGDIRYPDRDELLLLHYKYLGKAYTSERHAELRRGLGATDLANDWGHKYSWSAGELDADWQLTQAQAVDIADPELRPWDSHPHPRWWRDLVPRGLPPGAGL